MSTGVRYRKRTSGPAVLAPVRRMPLTVRLALLLGLLTAAAVGAVFVALSMGTAGRARDVLAAELGEHQRALLALQRQTLQQVLVTSVLIGESPTLRAAMVTYREESSSRRIPRRQLVATIQSALGSLAADLPQALLAVTDDQGIVLWAADRSGPPIPSGTDFSRLPAVRTALDSSAASQESHFAIVQVHGSVFQLGCVPIVQDGFPIGTLLLGDRLDAQSAGRLKQTLGSDVVIRAGSSVLAASLPDLPGTLLAGSADHLVSAAGETFVTASIPIGRDERGEVVTMDLLRPLSTRTAALRAALTRSFLLWGVLGVALAIFASAIAARSALQSFRDFVRFMGAVASSRDYSRRFVDPRPTPEMETLADAYTHLISSLSESHAQLEARSTELSHTNAELRQEVEERERAERTLRERDEQLRQSQKLEAIGTLAGGVAHDFNNLLTVIHSYTELLMGQVPRDSAMHADLEQVRQAAARAGRLTSDLLAFSRKQVMQPRVLDLNTVVGGVEKMLRRLIGEHIQFTTELPRRLGRVKADPGQLEQVIVNLAVNARDAMPKGGRLLVRTGEVSIETPDPALHGSTPPGRWITLSVTDTGTGMDEPTLQRIFEPFFTTKAVGQGTGLGLAMVYGIVTQSGGHIHVQSKVGQGTTFVIYLPQIADVEEAAEENGHAPGRFTGSETVLVVEDEDMVRSLSERTLRSHGYNVLTAANGAEALDLIERFGGPVDLLLTDVVMPEMSGKDLAEAVTRRFPGMKVVYMSGYTEDTIVHHGVLEQGVELLSKPFTPTTMARRIREVLDAPAAGIHATE